MEFLLTLMPETLTERLAALTGVVVSLALFFFAFSAKREGTVVPVAAPTSAPTAAPVEETTPVVPVASRPVAPAPARASTVALVLTAARGDCWVSLRSGSADGKVLYEGVLVSGRTVRAKAPQLWIRLGAAANLDITLNGKRAAALPAGTIDVVATPKGIGPAT